MVRFVGLVAGLLCCTLPVGAFVGPARRSRPAVTSMAATDGTRREWSSGVLALLSSVAVLPGQRACAESDAAAPVEGSPEPAPAPAPAPEFPDFELPYKNTLLPLSKFRGKAMIVVNIKSDDPQSQTQYPALSYLNQKYFQDGLRILAFPTDQGYYEPDIAELVRIRALQGFNFGQFPFAVIFDKVDILGPTGHPFFRYLMKTLRNPNGKAAISLNYEKFLLDSNGVPVRRYPRKYTGYQMEADVAALLRGDPLPEETPAFQKAWLAAKKEAKQSEYAFRVGYNVYNQDTVSTDWEGIREEGFR